MPWGLGKAITMASDISMAVQSKPDKWGSSVPGKRKYPEFIIIYSPLIWLHRALAIINNNVKQCSQIRSRVKYRKMPKRFQEIYDRSVFFRTNDKQKVYQFSNYLMNFLKTNLWTNWPSLAVTSRKHFQDFREMLFSDFFIQLANLLTSKCCDEQALSLHFN